MAEPPARARRGLGRGLSALLGDPADAGGDAESTILTVPVDSVAPNPDQPRRTIDERALDVLADSIRTHGLMQPLVVRPLPGDRYELIAGERRWRAAERAGLEDIPVVIRDAGERERLELALVENLVREDLSPIEVARAVAALVEDFGQTHQQVATHLGRSRPAVSNLLRLLELPEDVQARVDEGALSEGHGRAVLMVEGSRARRKLAEQAIALGWSVRETERRARLVAAPSPASRRSAAPDGPLADATLDAFTAVFDAPVRLRTTSGGGMVVELRFADEDGLRAALTRLGAGD